MMLSPSFSGTTVWHTASRVRNSCIQAAVGYKRDTELTHLRRPRWHASERRPAPRGPAARPLRPLPAAQTCGPQSGLARSRCALGALTRRAASPFVSPSIGFCSGHLRRPSWRLPPWLRAHVVGENEEQASAPLAPQHPASDSPATHMLPPCVARAGRASRSPALLIDARPGLASRRRSDLRRFTAARPPRKRGGPRPLRHHAAAGYVTSAPQPYGLLQPACERTSHPPPCLQNKTGIVPGMHLHAFICMHLMHFFVFPPTHGMLTLLHWD